MSNKNRQKAGGLTTMSSCILFCICACLDENGSKMIALVTMGSIPIWYSSNTDKYTSHQNNLWMKSQVHVL